MSFSEFGGQQVGQLDLADFTFDLGISHRRIEIVLKARLGQQLYEQLLSQICMSAGGAFFDQEAGAARCTHQRVIADNTMKFRPQTVNVGIPQTFDPVTGPGAALGGAAGTRNFSWYGDAGIRRRLMSD